MKHKIKTLHDALVYELQGLYDAERKLKEYLNKCSTEKMSKELRTQIQRYTDSTDSKLLNLERVFNYLMQEPIIRKNEVINHFLQETHYLLTHTFSRDIRDILMATCIQSINSYKIRCYKTAYLFAIELELETAADLLEQILEWEIEMKEQLMECTTSQLNKSNKKIDLNLSEC